VRSLSHGWSIHNFTFLLLKKQFSRISQGGRRNL